MRIWARGKRPCLSTFAISLLLFLFLSSQAVAEKNTPVYKWVDKDGQVHYAAQPGDKNAQKLHVGSKVFHKKSDEQKQAEQKKQQERQKICQESKETLERYKKAPFLYRYDDKLKQKVRLTESEAKDAFIQVEKDIAYWCKPQTSQP